jgi:hypothetical protein
MSRDRATPSPEPPKVAEQVETSTEKRVSSGCRDDFLSIVPLTDAPNVAYNRRLDEGSPSTGVHLPPLAVLLRCPRLGRRMRLARSHHPNPDP